MIRAGIFDVGGVLHDCNLFPPSDEAMKEFSMPVDEFREEYFNHPILELVKKLKGNYKLGIITDTIKSHREYLEKTGIFDDFDVKIFSYEVELRKPNPDIFKLAIEKLGVKPEEAFYVDDYAYNTDGAAEVGLHPVVYTQYDKLVQDLQKLGVNI